MYFPNTRRIATSQRHWNSYLFRQHSPYIVSKIVHIVVQQNRKETSRKLFVSKVPKSDSNVEHRFQPKNRVHKSFLEIRKKKKMCFQKLLKFQQPLKTCVILILNFTRPHAITYAYFERQRLSSSGCYKLFMTNEQANNQTVCNTLMKKGSAF